MQMVKNIIIVMILLPLFAIMLMPKKEIYYKLEEQLKQKSIVISNEKLKDTLFGLTIEHPEIYFNGAKVARAESIEIWSLLAYTDIDIVGAKIVEGMPIHADITSANIKHTILSPLNLELEADTSLGGINGDISLMDRTVSIAIDNNGSKKGFEKYLKKGKEGWKYESRF